MQIPILATHAIQIRYRGTSSVFTIAVDGDGGTTAGLLTLTDDDGASAFDLGAAAYDTGAELVVAINAITDTGWEARLFRCHDLAPILSTVDLNTASKFSDLATCSVPRHWTNYLEFAATTETILAATTEVLDRSMPFPCAGMGMAKVVCQSVLSGAGTDVVTFTLVSATPQQTTVDTSNVEGSTVLTELGDSDWDTDANTGGMGVTSNGTTQVRENFQLDFRGYLFVKIGKVTNAAAAETATIGGYFANDPTAPSARS